MTRLRDYLRSIPWWLWVIAALALVLRLAPIGYGLPYELDTDEHLFVDAAWRMIENGDLDPDWYGNPATPLFAILAVHGAASAICALTPTPRDDEILGKIYKWIEKFALNIGKAKD